MGALRFSAILASILVLGIVLVAGLPDYPGAAAVSSGPRWREFGEHGGAILPPLGWTAYDPFSATTPYAGRTWFQELPPRTCRMTLLRADGGRFELFLVHGPTGALAPLVDRARTRFDGQGGVRVEEQPDAHSADGLPLHVDRATFTGGRTAYLAVGERSGHTLIVNAGGETGALDPDAFRQLLASVRIPRH